MSYKIAVVEDDKDMNSLLVFILKSSGFIVNSYLNFQEAEANSKEKFDLWLLDIMLGNESGFELFKLIKKNNQDMPVIFISARDKELDKIMGLELGSDDYITKPFSKKELILRINNVLRRANSLKYNEGKEKKMYLYDYLIDFNHMNVYYKDSEIELTSKEYDLLVFFIENMDLLVTREKILRTLWDYNYYGSERVVDDTIRRLRKKMPDIEIETVYGSGYRMKKI